MFSLAVTVIWCLAAAAAAGDVIARGVGGGWTRGEVISLLALSTATVAVVALFGRPAVVADAAGVTLRNVARDITVPWGRLDAVSVRWSLTLAAAGERYAAWAVPASRRRSARSAGAQLKYGGGSGTERAVTAREAYLAAGSRPRGGTWPDRVADDLVQRREAALDGAPTGVEPAPVSARWAWSVMGPFLASAVALAIVSAV